MIIHYLSSVKFPSQMANSIAIANQCEAMINLGHDVTLVVPRKQIDIKFNRNKWMEAFNITKSPTIKALPGIDLYACFGDKKVPHVLSVLAFFLQIISFQISVIVFLLKTKADVYITREIWTLATLLLMRRKVVIEVHDWPSTKSLQRLRIFLYKRANLVVCISENLKQELKSWSMVKPKIITLSSAVNIHSFNKADPVEIKDIISKLPNQKLIVYTGTISKSKGVDSLVKVTGKLKNKDISIVLVGRVVDNEILKNIPSNVKYLGHIEYRYIPSILKIADVLILPNPRSKYKKIYSNYTSPLKLYEYLASGKPILISDAEAFDEIVGMYNGVYQYKNIKELSVLIPKILAKPNHFYSRKVFSWEDRQKQLLENVY